MYEPQAIPNYAWPARPPLKSEHSYKFFVKGTSLPTFCVDHRCWTSKQVDVPIAQCGYTLSGYRAQLLDLVQCGQTDVLLEVFSVRARNLDSKLFMPWSPHHGPLTTSLRSCLVPIVQHAFSNIENVLHALSQRTLSFCPLGCCV